MSKKTLILTMVAALFLVVVFADAALAENIGEVVEEHAQEGGKALKEEITILVGNVVSFARGIAGVLGVVFVLWAGFIFWGAGGDPRKMAFAKSMIAGFILCIIFVFAAEKIVGGLLGLLGYGG
ncbi:MAG: hypothetical protein K9L17_08405 [Clostridiales bacterium]|nr:hypothetical protein [Clostridiales bacterium]MCF8022697.1 hypothetical protein [Clostridiales bacterium]